MKKGPRIVSGRLSGLYLQSSKVNDLRPTSERVRVSMFDIITPKILNRCFIDLFAGTGINGIEALSRGAARAVFLELKKSLCQELISNLARLELAEVSLVVHGDSRYLISKSINNCVNPVIFLDPPYGSNLINESLNLIDRTPINSNSLIITESHFKTELQETYEHLRIGRREIYGDTALTFWDFQ